MRLWHQDLIEKLPRQQLLGQHRECAALRGRGWGKPHATVNYVFEHSPYCLYAYHLLIMEEMQKRGYQPDSLWLDKDYRARLTMSCQLRRSNILFIRSMTQPICKNAWKI